jgi:Transglycosylase SLT domain
MPVGNPNPFTASNVYAQIAFPAFNILDSLVNLTKERSWDLTSVSGNTFNTQSAARVPSKPFIVGFIPPDVPINFVPTQVNQSTLTTTALAATPAGPTPLPQPIPKGYSSTVIQPPAYYQALTAAAQANNIQPADMLAIQLQESGCNPTQQSHAVDPTTGQPVAVGTIQFTQATAQSLGTSQSALLMMTAAQQQPYVQKFYAGANGAPTAGALYTYNFAPAAYRASGGGSDPNYVIFSKATSGDNYSLNSTLDSGNKGYITVGDMNTAMDAIKSTPAYQQQLAALNAATNNNYQYPDPTIPNPAANPVATTSIMTNGNVTDAQLSNPKAIIGGQLALSDTRAGVVQQQTNYLNTQISLIQQTPALMMLVNPSDFNRSYEHSVDPVKTRPGYVINMWLEKPLVITSKGVTAGQYAFQSDGSGGLVHQNRIQSISYQNLMSLVGIFKNNGNTFTDDTFGDSNSGIPLISLSVYIYYDNHIYIGSFDEFEITDDGNKPFNLSYSWKFTVRYDLDTTQVLDSSVASAAGSSLSTYGTQPAGGIPPGISNPLAGSSSPVNLNIPTVVT